MTIPIDSPDVTHQISHELRQSSRPPQLFCFSERLFGSQPRVSHSRD
jgi:hypothetical protein